MIRYRLVCAEEDREILTAVCRGHSVPLDDASPYVLREEDVPYDGPSDIVISFQKDKIDTLMEYLSMRSRQESSLLMGAADRHFSPVEIPRIAYIRACGNDTFAHTADGGAYKIKPKLYELEDGILPRSFIRINKSEIVNIKHVQKIIPMFKGKLVLTLQGFPQGVDVSRNYVKSFKERIGM
mgnify:CR=1 FL=1